MRKIGNKIFRSIHNKLFGLMFSTILLMALANTIVLLYQADNLTGLVRGTADRQQAAIGQISDETMRAVVEQSLGRSTELEANLADDVFQDLQGQVQVLGQAAYQVMIHPKNYEPRAVSYPKAANDGKTAVQFISAEGVELTNPKIAEKMALLGNLSDVMTAIYDNTPMLNSCFVALPEGAALIVDDRSADKFDEHGIQTHVDITNRPWYVGATSTRELYFTEVERDSFTGELGIVCALPVYRTGTGELLCVVGADLFLDSIEEVVMSSGEDLGHVAYIISQEGHVIFSPESEGALAAGNDNVRETAPEVYDLVQEIFATKRAAEESGAPEEETHAGTSLREIQVDGTNYYMVGHPLTRVNLAVISSVSKERTDMPTVALQQSYAGIQNEARTELLSSLAGARTSIILLILGILILGTINSRILSGRIVRPLTRMTQALEQSEANNAELRASGALPDEAADAGRFVMDKAYETGDEIQVLALALADISGKAADYIRQITRITAEKERLGAELDLAKEIQSDQLPTIFPPYPERHEFELYASMDPAREVGGDFYDFFLVDEDHLALVIADVSGKGVPAALMMMIAKTLLKNRLLSGDTPGQALAAVNNQLLVENDAKMFVTIWAAVLQISTGKGIAANAGHEHPTIRHAGGDYELIQYRHSPPVATMEGIKFREHEFTLNPGDSLFVYTDGVPEATNAAVEAFGSERILEALNKDPDAMPREILANMTKALDDFVQDAEQFDDITMLGLYFRGAQHGEEDGAMDKGELTVNAVDTETPRVMAFVADALETLGCTGKPANQIMVATEEIFVNIAHYAYTGTTGKARILWEKGDEGTVRIGFIDKGAPFDPLAKQDPDTALSAEDRPIGGLGIFLVKKTMDDMTYEYADGENRLWITKKFG